MVKILMAFALLTSAGVNAESLGLGKTENGIFYAKGIPYAEPPEGDLRWAPPVDKVFEKSMAASHHYFITAASLDVSLYPVQCCRLCSSVH